jgi:hypothetical protein
MIQKGFQVTNIESVMQNVFAAAAASSSGLYFLLLQPQPRLAPPHTFQGPLNQDTQMFT